MQQTDRVLDLAKSKLAEKVANYTKDLITANDYHAIVHLQERVKSLQHAIEMIDHCCREALEE